MCEPGKIHTEGIKKHQVGVNMPVFIGMRALRGHRKHRNPGGGQNERYRRSSHDLWPKMAVLAQKAFEASTSVGPKPTETATLERLR